MPLPNRVLPTGEIIATPARGTLMGNRGILHDDGQRLTNRRWQHPHWVACVTKYKDWHREVMQPRNYTELFFLDEPTALAAGHRPCGLCRRADFTTFKALFNAANGTTVLSEIDQLMQRHRVTRARAQVRHEADLSALPDGSFVLWNELAHLVWDAKLLQYSPEGYAQAVARPSGQVTVLTPACTIETLLAGYRPALHPSAKALL